MKSSVFRTTGKPVSWKHTTEEYENDKNNIIAKYNEHGYRDAVLLSDSVVNFNEKKVDIYLKVEEGDKYYLKDILHH